MALSKNLINEADRIANMMTYLELSTNPKFMDQYMAALFFPHTHMNQFPTVMERLAEARQRAKIGREEASGGEAG
jgi:uncharacterized 2Fe-2S/4Fe-4S cluster protein (DUF4445 family)